MRKAAAIVMLSVLTGSIGAAQTDSFAPLRFLLGQWRAIDTQPGETGAFAFTLAVQDHVVIRTNEANYAATAGRAASRHDDLLVIYAENSSVKADYFDNEGHIIRYTVEPLGDRAVAFVSAPDPRQPRYRLIYRGGANDTLVGTFEIAPSESPDAFKLYLSWKATHAQP